MKYAIIILSLALISSIAYSMNIEKDPWIILEQENRQKIISCLENVYTKTWSNDMKKQIKFCESLPLLTIWTHSTGSTVPPWQSWNKSVSIECEWWEIEKIEGIEFHYTATDENTTLQAIKNWHTSKYWSEHIWYHYVIKPNGEITSTRDTKCVAWADKWSRNNYRFIQIAFIGDDKPTKDQWESMARLAKSMQIKYNLPIDSVSAHSEWWQKSKKESLEYWFWSKDEFIKMIRGYYHISIYWKQSPELTYLWRAWGDKDFIGTIFAESRMNNGSIWDGWNSIWYCQIHKWYQPWWYAEYSKITTMEERLNYCHEKYTYAKTLKDWVWSRFHWYNARSKHIENISIY